MWSYTLGQHVVYSEDGNYVLQRISRCEVTTEILKFQVFWDIKWILITLDNKFQKTFCVYDEHVINLFVCFYEVRKGT